MNFNYQSSWTTLSHTMVLLEVIKRSLDLQSWSRPIWWEPLSPWKKLWSPLKPVRSPLYAEIQVSNNTIAEMQTNSLIISLGKLCFAASKFRGSLYHQKHAFYFREVKKWVDCLWVGSHSVSVSCYLPFHLDRTDCAQRMVIADN